MSRSRGLDLVDDPLIDQDLAVGNVFQAGKHAQGTCGFAAAGWSDQHDEFAVLDRKVDGVNDFERPVPLDQFLRFNAHVHIRSISA